MARGCHRAETGRARTERQLRPWFRAVARPAGPPAAGAPHAL